MIIIIWYLINSYFWYYADAEQRMYESIKTFH